MFGVSVIRHESLFLFLFLCERFGGIALGFDAGMVLFMLPLEDDVLSDGCV